jgi:hypothetical protein
VVKTKLSTKIHEENWLINEQITNFLKFLVHSTLTIRPLQKNLIAHFAIKGSMFEPPKRSCSFFLPANRSFQSPYECSLCTLTLKSPKAAENTAVSLFKILLLIKPSVRKIHRIQYLLCSFQLKCM